MQPSALAPVSILVVVLATDAWVAWDASRHRVQGRDVVVTVGPITLDRPEHWLIACIVLWPIAVPLYLVARRASRE